MLTMIPRVFCMTSAELMAASALPVDPPPYLLLGPDQGQALLGVRLQGGGTLLQKSSKRAGRPS